MDRSQMTSRGKLQPTREGSKKYGTSQHSLPTSSFRGKVGVETAAHKAGEGTGQPKKSRGSSLGKVGTETTVQAEATVQAQKLETSQLDTRGPQRSQPSKSKKRVWKQTDPLAFPASAYHWPLFRCNHPFITKANKPPENNKFGKLKMNMEVRRRAVEFLLDPYLSKFRKLEVLGELSGHQLHMALFDNIWQLTTPSAILLEKIRRMEMDCGMRYNRKRRRVDELDEKVQRKDLRHTNIDFALGEVGPYDEEEKEEEEEEGKWDEEENEEDHEKFLEGTNEIFKLIEESQSDNGEESGRGRMDIKLWVYNHSNVALQEKFEIFNDLDSKRTICIVECKWNKKERDQSIYQAACYACQEAFKNINNLHFSSIYLIILFEAEWTYGILDPHGTINIFDGKIEETSYPTFEKQERLQFKNTSFERLEALLDDGTKYYQQHFLNHPDAIYPNGAYLVGTLHVVDEWYKLPTLGTPGGGNAYDVHNFFEGLLRVVIGDHVTSWGMEDFESAKACKEEILAIEKELFFYM